MKKSLFVVSAAIFIRCSTSLAHTSVNENRAHQEKEGASRQ